MKGHKCFGLVALLAVLGSVLAVDKEKYVEVGRPLRLRPTEASSDHISNILWKYNGNLVVEWVEDKVDQEFYSKFKGRSRLDTKDGTLEVQDMTKGDLGIYSAEINNLVQSDRYDVKVIRAVSLPEVMARPLTCGPGSDNCTLVCNGLSITDAEPIIYSWKRDDQTLQVTTLNLTITNDEETRRVKTYSCLMKNPVSERWSNAHNNPFFKEETGSSTGLIVALVVILILGIAAVLAWTQRKRIQEFFNKNKGGNNTTKISEGAHPSNQPLNESPET